MRELSFDVAQALVYLRHNAARSVFSPRPRTTSHSSPPIASLPDTHIHHLSITFLS
jgi:hypothetical protein